MSVLRDRQLFRLNFGIFALHAILMAIFVVVPFALQTHLPSSRHWQVYLPVMVGSILLMLRRCWSRNARNLQNRCSSAR